LLGIAAFTTLLAGGPADAAFLTIGEPADPGSGNCFPFGCDGFDVQPGTRYQQVYNQGLFSGPVTVSEIAFFNTQQNPGGAIIDPATYDIRFSTTSKAVNGLDTSNFDNNVGTNTQFFFVGTLGGAVGGPVFSIGGSPYNYDPADGNLLMDIRKGGEPGQGDAFLDARNGTFGDDSSRAHNFGSAFENFGLVTRFNLGGPGPVVPEPSSLILMGLGLAGGVATKKRWKARKSGT
jgi:hypothetical protein